MKLVVCNQKAYLNVQQVDTFIQKLKQINYPDLVICPTSIYLEKFKILNIALGSQNVSIYHNGSHTGEITASQLKDLNVAYTIVGHSEQKDLTENKITRIKQLLKSGITPILCIGETEQDKANNKSQSVIYKQLLEVLTHIEKTFIKNIIIAYEPLYSIGTGIIPTNEEIDGMAYYIKDTIYKEFSAKVKVLYGGSVNSGNINTLNKNQHIDGYLIGKASTDIKEIQEILNKC